MRAGVIVVVAPCRNQMAGMAQCREQVFVEAFIPQASVEALHEAVLHRFARRDVMPFDLAILLPIQHGVRLVSSVPLSLTNMQGKPRISAILSSSRATRLSRQRSIDHSRPTFSAEVVDDAENAEPAAVRQRV